MVERKSARLSSRQLALRLVKKSATESSKSAIVDSSTSSSSVAKTTQPQLSLVKISSKMRAATATATKVAKKSLPLQNSKRQVLKANRKPSSKNRARTRCRAELNERGGRRKRRATNPGVSIKRARRPRSSSRRSVSKKDQAHAAHNEPVMTIDGEDLTAESVFHNLDSMSSNLQNEQIDDHQTNRRRASTSSSSQPNQNYHYYQMPIGGHPRENYHRIHHHHNYHHHELTWMRQLRKETAKFEKASRQLAILDQHIHDLQNSFSNSIECDRKTFKILYRMQLATYEGTRNAYIEYIERQIEKIKRLRCFVLATTAASGSASATDVTPTTT